MKKRVRILHLEDNPNDAELVQSLLSSGGIDCDITRVQTRSDFVSALAQGGFDLIMSDHTLPSFDGKSALTIAQETCPEAPFIFVSGTIGEDAAVDSLLRGATDYVLKDRLKRLVPAVRRALREVNDRHVRAQAEQSVMDGEKRFRTLVEKCSDAIALVDARGSILYASPATRTLGYAVEELVGCDAFTLVHPDDVDRVTNSFVELMQQEGRNSSVQCRVRHKDGSWIWVEGVWTNLLSESSVEAVVANFRVITERKREEEDLRKENETLQQKVRELMAATKELEAFSHAVSHCLRTPLEIMVGYIQLLLRDYGGKLDSHGEDYLHCIRTATQRMGQSIEDLMMLSGISHGRMHRTTVNLSALAEAIADDLKRTQPDRRVDFLIQPRLLVYADPNLMRIALENLIGNAWKFTSKRPYALIQIGVTERAGATAHFVRDNGVGFNMANAGKLFGAFQRLHSYSEFEGTGIGLVIVKRIIDRHGGTIGAEGEPDNGARFYFSLPKC
jgi:PAS domain S-box-containing protein